MFVFPFLIFILLPLYTFALRFAGSREIRQNGKLTLGYKIQALCLLLMSLLVPIWVASFSGFSDLVQAGKWLTVPILVAIFVFAYPKSRN